MKSYYLAALSCITVLIGAWYAWPFPRFDVATLPARPEATGYNREDFGIWQPHGACTTREVILESQASDPLENCHAHSGTVYDPYSGTPIPATSPIEIDHIFPLSAAYDMGASEWDRESKVRFGNDPLNLVATSRELNQEKSDSLPAEWLPPANGCDYSRRLADIARKYSLPLPSKDVRAMQRQCRLALLTGN
ncbi:HNH endonuclease family protein [Corynebacterium tuberculostearicum]|uniref:HNH endonuclease family protein n=1 Tax=Corynebacterium tuberculostearicum TaxID=38304 RepID=UPI002647AF10|nr:HNH endonuclease family protein [Corynebacterium tuberculostearicum]MDV2431893.1 HNH endonuclease family protein [Corynebacterium tuberculostearicum]WKE59700.1 HNH endonuclease [Corynebacterium tuberculostearicum]